MYYGGSQPDINKLPISTIPKDIMFQNYLGIYLYKKIDYVHENWIH